MGISQDFPIQMNGLFFQSGQYTSKLHEIFLFLNAVCMRMTLPIIQQFPQVNPSQKLSLVASCTNCNRKPIYTWQMFKKPHGSEEEFNISDTETLRRFAHTNISRDQNLVLKAHALDPDFMYLVKLNGPWSVGQHDTVRSGFSMYTIGKVLLLFSLLNRECMMKLDAVKDYLVL